MAATNDTRNISVWIFQANPTNYDIRRAISDRTVDNEIVWRVSQHKEEIKKGDIAIIWEAGEHGGILALARIETDPDPSINESLAEGKYWIKKLPSENVPFVRLIILRRFDKTIGRKDISMSPELSNLSILNNAQGTNFPVNSTEWEKISKWF